jgi:sporulation protein YlmC with PRC-barrel domain
MNAQPSFAKWLKFLPLFILALALAACQPAEEPVQPMDGTPFAPVAPTDPDPLATPAVTPDPVGTPIGIDTPVVTPEPMETPMMTPEVTPPTVIETPAVAPAVTPDLAVTPDMDDEAVIERDMTVVVRASDLIGMNVVDQRGETIGDVSEVLVDAEGAIVYVFFDAGGFLGIGTRTTAVEWDAFDIRSERHMGMVTRPGAPAAPPAGAQPGTPGATPPSGTQPQPGTPGATPAPGTGAQPGVGVGRTDDHTQMIVLDQTAVLVYRGDHETLQTAREVDPDAVGRDTFLIDRRELGLERRDPAAPARPHADQLMPLTWFTGLTGSVDLVNRQGEDLGNVSDVIVVLQPGTEMRPAGMQQQEEAGEQQQQQQTMRHLRQDDGFILYAVVDFGGFLGIGTTTVLVPWDVLEIDAENERLILEVDRQTLEAVPTHDWGMWRDPIDLTWDEEIRMWWHQERGWTPHWGAGTRTQP